MWTIIGLLCIAAVAGVIAATSLTCAVGLATGTDTWCSMLTPLVGTPIAIACALVAGLPAYLLFRSLRLSQWWQFALGGALIALPLWYEFATPFNSARWAHAGAFDTLNYLGSGLLAGLAFYLLLRVWRKSKTIWGQ